MWNSDWIISTVERVTKRVKVGYVGSCQRDYCTESQGIPMIRTTNLTNEGVSFADLKYVTKDFHDRNKKSQLKKGDILIARHGDNGKACIFDSDIEANCLNIVVIEPDENKMYSEFLKYVFDYDEVKNQIQGLTVGSVQSVINTKTIAQLIIGVPSLAEQKNIIDILGSLDKRIANNKKINQNLAEQRMAIFKSWFIHFDPFMGQRPNSWKLIQFSDFLIERKEKSNDPDIPLYSITDTGIYPREKKFNKKLSAKTTFNKVLYKNDLAFGMSREILNWGVMKDTVGAVSSAYNVYSVNNGISSVYLELFMKSKIGTFRDLIRPATREGQSIDKGCLMNKIIYYPDETILERYLIFDSIFENKMSVIQKETNALQELRDTLLPKLMSGEIDVSGIDI